MERRDFLKLMGAITSIVGAGAILRQRWGTMA
ncbi:MAG: twin-arginine translocation signal domain-containing protein [Anaerolineae bacterium]